MLYETVSANAHYWSTVIDALSCVYNYMGTCDDDEQYDIRYQEFREAVKAANDAYTYCGASYDDPFDMSDDQEIDEFFSFMVMHPDHLKGCYRQAIKNFKYEASAIPLRLLLWPIWADFDTFVGV